MIEWLKIHEKNPVTSVSTYGSKRKTPEAVGSCIIICGRTYYEIATESYQMINQKFMESSAVEMFKWVHLVRKRWVKSDPETRVKAYIA